MWKTSDSNSAEPQITCTHKKKYCKIENLTHPTTPPAAHFIIGDPWLGVRAVAASVKTVLHSEKKIKFHNADQEAKKSSQETSTLASYQLNLFSFNYFHNCIRLIHLLHPLLLLSLGWCLFFPTLRNQQHAEISTTLPSLSCETDLGSTGPVFFLPPLPTKQEWTFP